MAARSRWIIPFAATALAVPAVMSAHTPLAAGSPAPFDYTVPAGICAVTISATGGTGGRGGADGSSAAGSVGTHGGSITASFAVDAGDVLTIEVGVGVAGTNGTSGSAGTAANLSFSGIGGAGGA